MLCQVALGRSTGVAPPAYGEAHRRRVGPAPLAVAEKTAQRLQESRCRPATTSAGLASSARASRPFRRDATGRRLHLTISSASSAAAAARPAQGAESEPGFAALPASVPTRWRRAVVFIALSMLACNLDRTALAVAGLPIRDEFGFSAGSMGVLQSSYLWGYFLGQLPSGILADKYGGPTVMLFGLLVWSLATVALASAHLFANPLAVMAASRCVFGLASAVALPAVSAGVSALVPKKRRGRMLSYIYATFNVGSILGVAVTPPLTAAYGWKAAFVFFGVFGVVVACIAQLVVPRAHNPIVPGSEAGPVETSKAKETAAGDDGLGEDDGAFEAGGEQPARPAERGPAQTILASFRIGQVMNLIWVHGVIGWGYFILLSWIPTYLKEFMAGQSLGAVGLLSAIPWIVSAAVGVWGGSVSDFLAQKLNWESFRIRTTMHSLATVGPGVALLLLPLVQDKLFAVALLCGTLGMQSFNYTGFHAHIQDVAAPYAGTILSITNSMGIMMGIVGNILTGVVLEQTGSFSTIFYITGALYLSSFLLWVTRMGSLPLVKKMPKPAGERVYKTAR